MTGNRKRVRHPASSQWLLVGSTLFSLSAFAANSLFCRLALKDGGIDPVAFTAIRLLGGSLFLWLLLQLRRTSPAGGSWRGGISLFVYAYLFSLAYIQLDAGAGALILFGAVQLTMFALAWKSGEKLRAAVVIGMLIAFSGLIILLVPGSHAPPLKSALAMVVAGMAWGAYSILGKGSVNPIGDTAGNFVRSLPLIGVAAAVALVQGAMSLTPSGVFYAIASGVLASGAGYAVWYSIMGKLGAQTAATLQLGVPILASIGGVLFLSEPISMRLLIASLVVLGGIAIAILGPRRKTASAN
ncbi:DMT family transporter [Pseudomonas matsuisoli]|uniref:EamA domain-containing protein n=1 Tax=Pseudomonas matsuisoli TaxID=1515666 RepID=A0A917PQU9_9PSED|nr:DMT family transporter [Pseudomonas matsuisoli]GGJ87782.1 hypothetical protein GCM10009304_11960 [Pseudomonas matsuisoli]